MNAVIESLTLGFEDHGIFTCYLHLKLQDGCNQAFGGYSLEQRPDLIPGVLRALNKREWQQLRGTAVRVEHTDGRITGIGHIVEDKWFRIR